MQKRCLGGFSVTWVPKLLLPLVRIRIFRPKTAKFGPKYLFLVILGHILAFLAHFGPWSTKITMRIRCLGGFSVMCVPELLLSPVKIRIFCPKTTEIGIVGHFGPGLAGSFDALLTG